MEPSDHELNYCKNFIIMLSLRTMNWSNHGLYGLFYYLYLNFWCIDTNQYNQSIINNFPFNFYFPPFPSLNMTIVYMFICTSNCSVTVIVLTALYKRNISCSELIPVELTRSESPVFSDVHRNNFCQNHCFPFDKVKILICSSENDFYCICGSYLVYFEFLLSIDKLPSNALLCLERELFWSSHYTIHPHTHQHQHHHLFLAVSQFPVVRSTESQESKSYMNIARQCTLGYI